MHVYLAEFIGTAILILLGNGVVANVVLNKSKGQGGGWIVITAGWGMAVAMAVYAVGRVSGAHINPAVTIALASLGQMELALVPGYIAAQLLGAIAGSVLVYLAYHAHWKVTDDPEGKRAIFCTAPEIRETIPNLMTEAIGTAMLVFGVLALGSLASHIPAENLQEGLRLGFGTWFAPLLVGLLVFSIGLSLGGPTGYAINPARDLGPRIAHALLPIPGKASNDWSYSWVPIVGPIAGGLAGAGAFALSGL
ncbi:MAG TPA: MIP/aquaporin family protein [Oceanipulchritudo sp.]|nr:MIP/aquaporin family protein [Oceanipulchritudo sp.]